MWRAYQSTVPVSYLWIQHWGRAGINVSIYNFTKQFEPSPGIYSSINETKEKAPQQQQSMIEHCWQSNDALVRWEGTHCLLSRTNNRSSPTLSFPQHFCLSYIFPHLKIKLLFHQKTRVCDEIFPCGISLCGDHVHQRCPMPSVMYVHFFFLNVLSVCEIRGWKDLKTLWSKHVVRTTLYLRYISNSQYRTKLSFCCSCWLYVLWCVLSLNSLHNPLFCQACMS